jgi:membrane-associated phospholipid phosphatase
MSGIVLYGWLTYLALSLPIARGAGIAVTLGAIVVIALSAPANVWTGAHWPSDVLGSYLWGAFLLQPLLFLDRWGPLIRRIR